MLLFAANVSGMSISYHFCGKIFQYIALNGHKKKSKCCCGGHGEQKGCCKTKHCKVTVDEGKSFTKQILFNKPVATDVLLPVYAPFVSHTVMLPAVAHTVPPAHAPPFIRTVPLRILYQQFLI